MYDTATRLKKILADSGTTQAEFGERIGASQSHVAHSMTAGRNFRLSSLQRLAWHLGYDVELVLTKRAEGKNDLPPEWKQ